MRVREISTYGDRLTGTGYYWDRNPNRGSEIRNAVLGILEGYEPGPIRKQLFEIVSEVGKTALLDGNSPEEAEERARSNVTFFFMTQAGVQVAEPDELLQTV